ncbi:Sodium channel protein type 4 subunit alpha B [Durusdinium trenchii]|uniref:Sodium channel protein type 4 subunit alpha B n=1 Tax=Durusdinium trenchii TaxID=1381693 RepID=A0ABP0M4T8_9DINO
MMCLSSYSGERQHNMYICIYTLFNIQFVHTLYTTEVWTFFRLLDGDSGQEIDMDEFLYGCMRLRGEAKALDLAKLMHSHAWLAKQQVDFMMFCEEKFVQIQGFLADGVLEAWHLQS